MKRETIGTCSNCRKKEVEVRKVKGSQTCRACFNRFASSSNAKAWLQKPPSEADVRAERLATLREMMYGPQQERRGNDPNQSDQTPGKPLPRKRWYAHAKAFLLSRLRGLSNPFGGT